MRRHCFAAGRSRTIGEHAHRLSVLLRRLRRAGLAGHRRAASCAARAAAASGPRWPCRSPRRSRSAGAAGPPPPAEPPPPPPPVDRERGRPVATPARRRRWSGWRRMPAWPQPSTRLRLAWAASLVVLAAGGRRCLCVARPDRRGVAAERPRLCRCSACNHRRNRRDDRLISSMPPPGSRPARPSPCCAGSARRSCATPRAAMTC